MKESFFLKALHILKQRIKNACHPRAIVWRRLQRKNPDKPVITSLGKGLKVRIYPNDVIGRDIYVHGVMEPKESAFVNQFLKPGMVFFDVGANMGQYTLFGAQRVGKTGKVHSFEPSRRMFGELEYNIQLNKLSDICVLNQAAISEASGTARLSQYEEGAEVYGSLGTQHWADKSIIGYDEVKTITLDEYIVERNISKIDLIKMDIEGAELLALKGAKRILSQSDAPVIILEMSDRNTSGFGYQAVDIWDFFANLGFSMYSLNRKGRLAGKAERPRDFAVGKNLVAMKHYPFEWRL